MSRIDVTILVLAFEKRISELNKNPPDLVPSKTISLMLESVVSEEIEKHFSYIIRKDIKDLLNEEFKRSKTKMVKQILKSIMDDSSFKLQIEAKIKKSIIDNII